MPNARDESIGVAVFSSMALIVLTMAGLTASMLLQNSAPAKPAEIPESPHAATVGRLRLPDPEADGSPSTNRESSGEVTRPHAAEKLQ